MSVYEKPQTDLSFNSTNLYGVPSGNDYEVRKQT